MPNKIIKLFFAIFFFSGSLVLAQPKGFKALTDEAKFREIYARTTENLKSLKCDFVQEKNLAVIDEQIVSNGSFHFKKPDKVRMEYTKPFSYILVINNDKIQVKDSQKTSSFSSGDSKLFKQVNQIIMDCIKGTIFTNKEFKTDIFENEKYFMIGMSPKSKDLKEFFNTIQLYIDKKDYSIHKMDMIEPQGDNTAILFTNKQINTEIPDAFFILK